MGRWRLLAGRYSVKPFSAMACGLVNSAMPVFMSRKPSLR